MDFNRNILTKKLVDYSQQNHEDKSMEQIMSEVKAILSECNATNPTINYTYGIFLSKSLVIKTVTLAEIPTSMAKAILRRNKLEQNVDLDESFNFDEDLDLEDNLDNKLPEVKAPKNKKTTNAVRRTRKLPKFSVNIASLGKSEPNDLVAFITQMLYDKGLSKDEVMGSSKSLTVLGMQDQAMDLNINQAAPLAEQIAESIQKLYRVLVNGESPLDVKRTYGLGPRPTDANTRINNTSIDRASSNPSRIDATLGNTMDVSNDNAIPYWLVELAESVGIDLNGDSGYTSGIGTSEELIATLQHLLDNPEVSDEMKTHIKKSLIDNGVHIANNSLSTSSHAAHEFDQITSGL